MQTENLHPVALMLICQTPRTPGGTIAKRNVPFCECTIGSPRHMLQGGAEGQEIWTPGEAWGAGIPADHCENGARRIALSQYGDLTPRLDNQGTGKQMQAWKKKKKKEQILNADWIIINEKQTFK